MLLILIQTYRNCNDLRIVLQSNIVSIFLPSIFPIIRIYVQVYFQIFVVSLLILDHGKVCPNQNLKIVYITYKKSTYFY